MESVIERTNTAGRTYQSQSASAVPSQEASREPVAELVATLRRRAKAGTSVEVARACRVSGICVDIIISSPTERVGIVCDHADARKIHHRPSVINELFVDRLYLTSSLDAIIDPEGLAARIAHGEHLLLDMSVDDGSEGGRRLRLSVVGRREADRVRVSRSDGLVRRSAPAEYQAA